MMTKDEKAAYNKAYYAAHRQSGIDRAKRWAEENKDRLNARRREWRKKNSESINASSRKKRAIDPERFRKREKEWALKNPQSNKDSCQRQYLKNKEKYLAQSKAWRVENPERAALLSRLKEQKRRSRKKGSSGDLSKELPGRLMILQRGLCAICHCKLSSYELDHIVPLYLGGLNADENIQLLCSGCNRSKGRKHPIEFMQQMGKLL